MRVRCWFLRIAPNFLAMIRRQTNSAVHRRMNALPLLDDGWTAERVAQALFIDAETVHVPIVVSTWPAAAPGWSGWPMPATRRLFVDATHPAYDAHPAQGWIRRGETAVLPSNHGRVNVTLNGVLSWLAREGITREATKIPGPEMAAFFAQIEARYPAARTITRIADNAT